MSDKSLRTDQELSQVLYKLGQIEGKIDAFAESQLVQDRHLTEIRGEMVSEHTKLGLSVKEIDKKVDGLQRWRSWVTGVAATVSAIVSFLGWRFFSDGS